MRRAGISGRIVPWRDVLHDGPVPSGLTLGELSALRTKFLAEAFDADPMNIERSFVERNDHLESLHHATPVVLWFEHDLYDQLQLLQILHWFSLHASENHALSLICTDHYLGTLTPRQLAALHKHERPVSTQQLHLAQRAWSAFCRNTPLAWHALLDTDTRALPFLEGTVLRLLEEYPATGNGLTRTERQALEIISSGVRSPGKVFARNQQCEERVFMGDWSFWNILRRFLGASPPLLELYGGKLLDPPAFKNQLLSLTTVGEDILRGTRDWLAIEAPNRWIGGVHLQRGNTWRWEAEHRSLEKAPG